MNIKIHQPHDTFLRRCLTNLEVAKDMILSCIPADLTQRIDWNTLELTNKSFAKEELKQIHGDIIYRCKLKGKPTYTYLALEHQSTPDRFFPFRVLGYNVALMEQHLEQIKTEKNKYLPDITNIFVYAGKITPYPHSLDICDCFADPIEARERIRMFNPILLKDLTILTEDELLKYGKADLVYILLKEGIKKDFLSFIKTKSQILARLFDRFYVKSGIIYILEVDDKTSPKELIEAILQVLPEKKAIIMSAAQQLRQEGIREGMREGIRKGMQKNKLTIAKNMLKKGYSTKDIQEITDLPKETIERLKQE